MTPVNETLEKKYKANEKGDCLIHLRSALNDTGVSQKQFVERAADYAAEFPNKKGKRYTFSISTLNLRSVHGIVPKAISKESFDGLLLKTAESFDEIKKWARQRGIKNGYLLGRDPNMRLDKSGRVIKGRQQLARNNHKQTYQGEVFLQMEAQMLNHETLNHFGLNGNPFSDALLNADSVWLSKPMKAALNSMIEAARSGGLMALISEVGSGKTVVRRMFYERLKNDSRVQLISVESIDKKHLHTSNIYQAIVRDLTADERPATNKEQAARQVKRLLAERVNSGVRPVIVFEEAHDLPDDVLRYLKRFHELGDEGFRKLSAIILVGQTELGLRLQPNRGYHLREVAQRLQRVDLKPLGNEMQPYLDYRFNLVKSRMEKTFDESALKEIRSTLKSRQNGNGRAHDYNYPLAVNNLCIASMNIAARTGERRVSANQIREAVRESQSW